MKRISIHRSPVSWLCGLALLTAGVCAQQLDDPKQIMERTCFQSFAPYADDINLRSDVAIVYGIDKGMPDRVKTWWDRGYRVHLMTGVSWGEYQDYLYGRFDNVNHEDEAQTDKYGNKISHGGDVYYMSPGANYGKFLCVGVKRALDAGVQAVHLEEPEFWVRAGYSEGFKKEWKAYYNEDWRPQHASVDAQWKSGKLKYYLYRRALQQVFDFIQAYNKEHGTDVKCYVPTHSLLSYAHWNIVSPESSLAQLKGCDGYIAQVWTGTARSPVYYNGEFKERTFESAFLEYSAMYNLVRSTGRTVWYLNDPVEDDPKHDWNDYRMNWESTLTASLLQPEVWRYEVMPWPDRVFRGRYPANVPADQRQGIPADYATELQIVMTALNDMNQSDWEWDHPSSKVGQFISDSLMFERGDFGFAPHLDYVYGLALPLVKRGIPVDMVQLENVGIKDYLKDYKMLLLTYEGMKPLSPDYHRPIADWVKKGGLLAIIDNDSDPFNAVKDWWNSDGRKYATPREHLMEVLDVKDPIVTPVGGTLYKLGKGCVYVEKKSPQKIATTAGEQANLMESLRFLASQNRKVKLNERSCLTLRRGPYFIAGGLDESIQEEPWGVDGRFVNLFDPSLKVLTSVDFTPGSRYFLLNLDKVQKGDEPSVLAAACKVWGEKKDQNRKQNGTFTCWLEGVSGTKAIMLFNIPNVPKNVILGGEKQTDFEYDVISRLMWLKFDNTASARELRIEY